MFASSAWPRTGCTDGTHVFIGIHLEVTVYELVNIVSANVTTNTEPPFPSMATSVIRGKDDIHRSHLP